MLRLLLTISALIFVAINLGRSEEVVKNETIKNTGFYVDHFKALKPKYNAICNKTNKAGVKEGIPYNTATTLFKLCVTPEMEVLKKQLNRHYERKIEKYPEIPDYIYPDLWLKIIDKCYRNKVANFCHRAIEGKVEKDPHNQTIEDAIKCAATVSVAFIPEIKALYEKHADTIKNIALKQMICIYDFFVNIEANDGKYVPPK